MSSITYKGAKFSVKLYKDNTNETLPVDFNLVPINKKRKRGVKLIIDFKPSVINKRCVVYINDEIHEEWMIENNCDEPGCNCLPEQTVVFYPQLN